MRVSSRSGRNISHILKFYTKKYFLTSILSRAGPSSSLTFFGVNKLIILSALRSKDLNTRCRKRAGVLFLGRVNLSCPETSSAEGDLTGVVSNECCLQTVSRSADCGLNKEILKL